MAQVFISYSKRDYIDPKGNIIPGNPIDKVIKALTENRITYWIDREGLDPGVVFAEKIAKNIHSCDVVLYLASQKANSSVWTLKEISTAIDFGKTVIPVRLDHTPYSEAVSLYLSHIQYIDWLELGEKESLERLVKMIKNPGVKQQDTFSNNDLPWITSVALFAGVVFLTVVYAVLSFQFLWAKTLRDTEIIGGLTGYVCEFGILMSIYYILRMFRRRYCIFVLPSLLGTITTFIGMLVDDRDLIHCGVLLLLGWGFLAICSGIKTGGRRSFFQQMSKEQTLLKITDSENLLLLYLLVKAVILVFAQYMDPSTLFTAI